MNVSYYTIDDIRLGYDPKGVTGWRLSQFLTFEDALKHYRELPASRVKAFGLTDGVHQLELVRCVPLFRYDREGECVLGSDYREFPLWRNVAQAKKEWETRMNGQEYHCLMPEDHKAPLGINREIMEKSFPRMSWESRTEKA